MMNSIRKPAATAVAVLLAGALLPACGPAQARVTRIAIDETAPAFCKGGACASYGAAGQYEQIAGRAWGELDPDDPLNSLVQDIQLAKDPGGMIPFARTKAERDAGGDPRPSLEERYGTHAGYVEAVRSAVRKVRAAGFLLESDGAALVEAAQASDVPR